MKMNSGISPIIFEKVLRKVRRYNGVKNPLYTVPRREKESFCNYDIISKKAPGK